MKKKSRNFKLLLTALLFTCALSTHLNAQLATGKAKFFGNIQTTGLPPANFDMYWNQLTPGNSGKWASCEQVRDSFNTWLWLDRAYSHAKQLGIPFKEHTLIWGGSSGDPTWIKSVPDSEQKAEVLEWFDTLSKRYPDFQMIDVVNEPLHNPPSYKNALGGDGTTGWDWVIWCYEQARIYFPNSKLILNDYNLLNYESECKNFLVIARLLKDRNLVDGISCQAHTLETIPIATIKKNLDSLAATGIDVYISEYDARGDDTTQLALYKQQFPVLYEHSAVKGVTLWGYLEGDMWRAEAYLLKSDGVTERPALAWLREYFNYSTDSTRYKFVTSVDGMGSITLNPSDGIYDPFTNVTVTAVPASGYTFSAWTGDKGGSENPFVMAVTSNRQVTAHFVSSSSIGVQRKSSENAQIQLRSDGRNINIVLPQAMARKANSRVEIIISDLQGKQVYKSAADAGTGSVVAFKLIPGRLCSGLYFAQVKIGGVIARRSITVFTE